MKIRMMLCLMALTIQSGGMAQFTVPAVPNPMQVKPYLQPPIYGGTTAESYTVTAVYPQGENAAGTVLNVSVASPTSSTPVTIAWNAVPGAISYNCYRNNQLIQSVSNSPCVDTGQAGGRSAPTVALPSAYTFATGGPNTVPAAMLNGTVWDNGGAVFNIKAYGASPSLPDNTAPIMAAWNAALAVHGTLYIPAGTYKVTSPLNFTNSTSIKIQGDVAGHRSLPGSELLYTGSALTSSCPFEFTNDDWLEINNIEFNATVGVACMALFGSAEAQSEDIRLGRVAFEDAGNQVSVATVADFGAEIMEIDDCATIQDGKIGWLFSSNAGSGYGITSNFGHTFSAHSMTQITFRGGKIIEGNGHELELDGTGNGNSLPVTDLSLFGVYMAGTATGSTGIYAKGTVTNLTVVAQRYEIDSATGYAAFLAGANGSTYQNVTVDDLYFSTSQPQYAIYSASSSDTISIQGGLIISTAGMSFYGNLQNVYYEDYNPLTISINGNANGDTFTSPNGLSSFSVSGSLYANINGISGVVWIAPIFGTGSSTYTFSNNDAGFFVATYTGNECSLNFAAEVPAGGNYVVSGVSNSDSAAGTLTCPTAGSTTTAPTIKATYTNTGGWFIVRHL